MTAISESSISLASTLPNSANSNAILASLLALCIAAGTFYYSSPLRLTDVLLAAIGDAEKLYFEALETGLLSASDVDTADKLSTLQLKVSSIREDSLRNSLSWRATLREFLQGRMIAILYCIHEVRTLKTRLEILKESQLRECDLYPVTTKEAQAVSLRRRNSPK